MLQKPPALLPAGLYDLLPPKASHERRVSGRLMKGFEQFGYAQVSPPMVEFESSLLAGRGEALASQTFRVMDPLSQEMMGVRPDITMQVGRIAATRLADAPRPLRLAYGGSTVRVKGDGTDHARQVRQAGIELIGTQDPKADAEVIAVAAHTIAAQGVAGLVVDLSLPGLVQRVLEASDVPAAKHDEISAAVESKDDGFVKAAGLSGYAAALGDMMQAAGPADGAIAALSKLDLPKEGKEQVAYLQAVVENLKALGAPVDVTVDPVENRGFEYHNTISFILFSREAGSELGRGGRYRIEVGEADEPATGITLYVNTLMQAVPVKDDKPTLLLPWGESVETAQKWQDEGYITCFASDGESAGCTHVLKDGKPHPKG